ncbi:MAG: MBL fold metallo-hydrolase [Gemmatimonadota bacterium]|nr:MBL fold metallo-hydrolase [Gemmatimonadota bacterium]
MPAVVRSFRADNPGRFTLDGTRSHVVGERRAAVIDPGPVLESHLGVLAEAVGDARDIVVLVTHAHADHAAGAEELARLTGAVVRGPGSGHDLRDGEAIATDGGDLFAVWTPGHARRHFCFHLPDEGAVFTGDLILGEGDTTWVGEYPGGVADYLASLDRVDALDARVLYPGHGDPLLDPADAIARFRNHRLARIDQVRHALAETGSADLDLLTERVYGELPSEVHDMAASGVGAILDYLASAG